MTDHSDRNNRWKEIYDNTEYMFSYAIIVVHGLLMVVSLIALAIVVFYHKRKEFFLIAIPAFFAMEGLFACWYYIWHFLFEDEKPFCFIA